MDGLGRRPRRIRLPAGLLGMLALMASVEVYLASNPLRFTDSASLSWSFSARAARDEAVAGEVLCVGDSLVKLGVLPAVIRERTGKSAYNLGVARGVTPATYFLLRRALEAGARPSAIVMDVKPAVLAGSPEYNLRYWQEIATPGEIIDLLRTEGSPKLLLPIALGRALPSVRCRQEARGNILAALLGRTDPLEETNRALSRNWTVNLGANVASGNPGFDGTIGPGDYRRLLSDVWLCHRVNAAYLRRLLDLTTEHAIPVLWVLPPVSPSYQARREETGVDEKYLRFVRESAAEHPNVAVVDGRHSSYDHSLFVDASHLNVRGAISLSCELSRLIDRPPPGSWVDLAPYRPHESAAVLEETRQSRLAVGGETGVRR